MCILYAYYIVFSKTKGTTSQVKSALSGKSAEEIAAALKELPADQLAKIKQACASGGAKSGVTWPQQQELGALCGETKGIRDWRTLPWPCGLQLHHRGGQGLQRAAGAA